MVAIFDRRLIYIYIYIYITKSERYCCRRLNEMTTFYAVNNLSRTATSWCLFGQLLASIHIKRYLGNRWSRQYEVGTVVIALHHAGCEITSFIFRNLHANEREREKKRGRGGQILWTEHLTRNGTMVSRRLNRTFNPFATICKRAFGSVSDALCVVCKPSHPTEKSRVRSNNATLTIKIPYKLNSKQP